MHKWQHPASRKALPVHGEFPWGWPFIIHCCPLFQPFYSHISIYLALATLAILSFVFSQSLHYFMSLFYVIFFSLGNSYCVLSSSWSFIVLLRASFPGILPCDISVFLYCSPPRCSVGSLDSGILDVIIMSYLSFYLSPMNTTPSTGSI